MTLSLLNLAPRCDLNEWYQAIVPKDYFIDKFYQVEGFLGCMEKDKVMVLYFEKRDSVLELLKGLDISVITEGDWVENWKEYFVPVKMGSFTVVPPWRAKEGNLIINPARGFGTGHHETTKLAEGLIEEVLRTDDTVKSLIDVGTGSGILAIAASKLRKDIEIKAIDNDCDAIENAFENLMLNDVVARIELSDTPLFKHKRPFDVVAANIISSVLYFLSDDLKRLSSRWLVLSGILDSESDTFLQKMELEDFELIKKVKDSEWNGFLLKRR